MLERIIETRSGKIVCIAFNKEFTDDMFLDYLWQWLHEYYGNLFSQDASAENQHFYFDINPENTGNKGNTLVNYRMWQRATQANSKSLLGYINIRRGHQENAYTIGFHMRNRASLSHRIDDLFSEGDARDFKDYLRKNYLNKPLEPLPRPGPVIPRIP